MSPAKCVTVNPAFLQDISHHVCRSWRNLQSRV